uniref:Uncharacterized protein n=1 Tax=Anopheles atroparvus TaxID=41427 RepID=A0A182IRU7_ANOAO
MSTVATVTRQGLAGPSVAAGRAFARGPRLLRQRTRGTVSGQHLRMVRILQLVLMVLMLVVAVVRRLLRRGSRLWNAHAVGYVSGRSGPVGGATVQVTVLYQRVQTLDLLVLGRIVDRALAVFVQRQLRTVVQQPAHHAQVAPRRGKVERRGAVTVAQIRIDRLVLDLQIVLAQSYGAIERKIGGLELLPDVRCGLGQQADAVEAAASRGVVQCQGATGRTLARGHRLGMGRVQMQPVSGLLVVGGVLHFEAGSRDARDRSLSVGADLATCWWQRTERKIVKKNENNEQEGPDGKRKKAEHTPKCSINTNHRCPLSRNDERAEWVWVVVVVMVTAIAGGKLAGISGRSNEGAAKSQNPERKRTTWAGCQGRRVVALRDPDDDYDDVTDDASGCSGPGEMVGFASKVHRPISPRAHDALDNVAQIKV